MTEITYAKIDEIRASEGIFDGIRAHRVAAGLGISAFGISIVDIEPDSDEYPEHDHAEEGIGGMMFVEHPNQIGQEEVYVALRGTGTLEADGAFYRLDPEHIVRVGPSVRRKVTPGPGGLRLLALGATPGVTYDGKAWA